MEIKDENGRTINTQLVEKSEQDLAEKYIWPNDVVLELGARYGSVSCVINSKLKTKTNQVVIEPDDRVWKALNQNKQRNGCEFHIVEGFVSNKKLGLTNLNVYLNGYGATFVDSELTKIPSYTLSSIEQKYGLKFNVLVADCEGFLERFFDENPNFYDNLRMIIFEADYPEKCNYETVRSALLSRHFVEILRGHQNVWTRA